MLMLLSSDVEAMMRAEYLVVETEEGARRTGRITKVLCRYKLILGKRIEEPISIEMNNEYNDEIDWAQIKSISIGRP